jgi:hypothetical protein
MATNIQPEVPPVPNPDDELNEGSVRTSVQASGVKAPSQELINLTTVEKLTGTENYGVWKFQMTIMFRARKLRKLLGSSWES